MKSLLTISTILLSANSALACQLAMPIALDRLDLEAKREVFHGAKTTPELVAFTKPEPWLRLYPVALNISYTKKFHSDSGPEVNVGPKAIGARVFFFDTVHGAGLSDAYMSGTKLKREVRTEGKTSVHVVSSSSSYTRNGEEVEYLDVKSEVTIADSKEITAISISESEFTRDAQGKINGTKLQTLCVDSIAP